MGCTECGRNIDIPDARPRAREPRTRMVLPDSEYALTADRAPAARSHDGSFGNPARSPPAAPPAPPALRDPEQDDSERRDKRAAQRVLDSFGDGDSGDSGALPEHGNSESVPSSPRSIRRKPKKKTKKRCESPQDFSIPRLSDLKSLDFERWKPAGLAIGSLAIFVGVAAYTVPRGMNASTYVWHKLGFMLTVALICTPFLAAASVLLGICYGELKMVLIKIPAIVLTQAWAEDILTLQPLPYVPTFGAWAVTLFLVANAFDLEGLEAQASLCIVRGTHTAVYWSMFAGLLSPPPDGVQPPANWLFQPEFNVRPEGVDMRGRAAQKDGVKRKEAGQDDVNKEKAQTDEPKSDESRLDQPGQGPRPVPQDRHAEDRNLSLTQKFGDALVAGDYERIRGKRCGATTAGCCSSKAVRECRWGPLNTMSANDRAGWTTTESWMRQVAPSLQSFLPPERGR